MKATGEDLRSEVRCHTEMKPQELLTAICENDRRAARFVLNWFIADPVEAVARLGEVLFDAFNDLDLNDAYLRPRRGRTPRLSAPGLSFSRVFLLYFCDLLHESPAFVSALVGSIEQRGLDPRENLLRVRTQNPVALTRGRSWHPVEFLDPVPVPEGLKDEFARWSAACEEKLRRERQAEILARARRRTERAYLRFVADLERRREAPSRRAFWMTAQALTLRERLVELASRPDRLRKHVPLDPRLLTRETFSGLERSILDALRVKLDGVWGAEWTEAARRLDAEIRARTST